jgi:hypothetical protein
VVSMLPDRMIAMSWEAAVITDSCEEYASKAGTRRYNLQNTPVYIPIFRYIYRYILQIIPSCASLTDSCEG